MFTRLVRSLLLTVLLVSSTARADDAATPARGSITATIVEGEVKATAKGGREARPVAAGDSLGEGDVVETGSESRLEVLLGSGTVLRLGPSTRAELRESPPEGGRFRLKLLVGNFWAHVTKLIAGDKFEVETENGVAGVRGTEFRAEAGTGGTEDLLRVYEGKVQVDSANGKWSHSVEPNRELRFHRDRGTAGPRAFDRASERSHPFMKWVRARGPRAQALKRPAPAAGGQQRHPGGAGGQQKKPPTKAPPEKRPHRRK